METKLAALWPGMAFMFFILSAYFVLLWRKYSDNRKFLNAMAPHLKDLHVHPERADDSAYSVDVVAVKEDGVSYTVLNARVVFAFADGTWRDAITKAPALCFTQWIYPSDYNLVLEVHDRIKANK